MITKFISDDFEVDLSPLFWYCFIFSTFAVFSSNPNFNDSFRFHRLRFIVRTFVCQYSLRVMLLRMIYKEIFRLRLIRIRDFIFLKFKRYIFSSQKFATIFSGIKELSVVVFLMFRFFTMYDFTVENGIQHFFRNILSCLSKSFYWMKPLYVIEEPPTR